MQWTLGHLATHEQMFPQADTLTVHKLSSSPEGGAVCNKALTSVVSPLGHWQSPRMEGEMQPSWSQRKQCISLLESFHQAACLGKGCVLSVGEKRQSSQKPDPIPHFLPTQRLLLNWGDHMPMIPEFWRLRQQVAPA